MNVKSVLVATDFSHHSDLALARGCELAAKFDCELHLIHVASPGIDEVTHGELSDKLRRLLTPQQLELSIERRVLSGIASREIVDYARQKRIGLIVLGTHGRTGLSHLTLGSVAEQVLRSASCPVLVVKPDEAEAEDSSIQVPRRAIPPEVETSPALDLVQRALLSRATDVHIDPAGEDSSAVRFRVDGQLEDYCKLAFDVAEHLVHQLKTLANLDNAEPFRPQEGRLRLPPSLPDLEVRITSSPVAGGEAVALRLFLRENVFFPLSALGFTGEAQALVESMLQLAEGIVLVTGPTGSGKTTTVYSMLEVLGTGTRNIVSIEDPVEFAAPFVRQMAVDERHGVTLATGLRTLLRMDPDIIFVGEIRDAETADIAMRAASSGQHVFSTLHTRDVAATVTALRDLHIDNRSLAGNLTGVINQRLVRRLCEKCRQSVPITDEQRAAFDAAHGPIPVELYEPVGCDACRGTGFHGRVGAFEAAIMGEPTATAIVAGASEDELRRQIRSADTLGIAANALLHTANGTTSYIEAVSARWL